VLRRVDVDERIQALRSGAEDWLTKPCHPEELIARIEAVASHLPGLQAADRDPVRFGEVEIRFDQYQAFVDGRSLDLTRREYQLVELLAHSDGQILTREAIYNKLWGYEMMRNDRSVDVFVHKLRRKLERASPDWVYIRTHYGTGYQLAPAPIETAAEVHELAPARAGDAIREAA
jgi:DNA-binding response OmpR family regulator